MMDASTPHNAAPLPVLRREKRASKAALALMALAAVGGAFVAGLLGGREELRPDWLPAAKSLGRLSKPFGPEASRIIYYRHPRGEPIYSAVETTAADGAAFVPVREGEDLTLSAAPEGSASAAGHASPAAETKDRKILFYRNPMGLPDTSPAPKKDSMGMDYLPVYDGEVDEGNIVKISPGKLQRTGVRSEPVRRQVVARQVRVPGTVQLDERRVAVVATRSEAFIDHVENVTTGDRVRKGQPLLHVYSPDIVAAAAQVISNPGAEGSRRRLQNLNVSDEIIAEIERTRKVPPSIQWSAPQDGYVLERNAIPGMRAAAGDVLFRIGDVSTVWVIADVPEHDLAAIQRGQSATVRLRSSPGLTFGGRVALIYPQVNRETRTTRVRIELPNPDSLFLPDMYADVEIATGSSTPVVAIAEDAVIDTGTRQVVLIDKGDGRFEPREVKLGLRGGGLVEIREGVDEGDKVVVSANFLIDAESNLKAALQALAPPAPSEEKPR